MSQPKMEKINEKSDTKTPKIKSISFGERPGPEPYNASEVVPLADSRFLFCDNNIGNTLFEFRLGRDGRLEGPLIPHPINGIEAGAVDDLEGMAFVKTAKHSYIFANPSLSLKQRKKTRRKKSSRGKVFRARNGLLRITVGDNGQLQAELVEGFREWLIEKAPELGKAPRYLPDDGGLNVEALGYDAGEQALLFGLRTPVRSGCPLILRLRLKDVDGPWALSNFEMLPSISLRIEGMVDEQGIRAMEYDSSRGESLIVVGNSTSSSKAPFSLYAWDGNPEGQVRRFPQVRFYKKMKVEGVTHGTIDGRGAIVFTDDAGGYQFLWDDDPRLQ